MHVAEQGSGAAALGHPVIFDEQPRPAGEHIGLQRRGEGRAGAGLEGEARQVEAVEIGQRHDPLILDRHEHRMGGPVLRRLRHEGARVELAEQHRGAAPGDGGDEADQRGVRIERGGDHRHRIGEAAGRAGDVDPPHRLGLDDALGHAGGAGAVDDVERIVGADLDRYGPAALRRQEGVESDARIAIVERHPLRRDGRVAQRLRSGGIEEQDPRPAIGDHRGELRRRGRRLERRGNAAGPQRAEKGTGIFDRRRAEDRDRYVPGQPFALKRRGNTVEHRVERGIADRPVLADHRRLVRPLLRMAADQIGQCGEFAGEHRFGTHSFSPVPGTPRRAPGRRPYAFFEKMLNRPVAVPRQGRGAYGRTAR